MIVVDIIDDRLIVEAPARLADIIAQIPGLRVQDGVWVGAATPATMFAVAKDLGKVRGFTPSQRATDFMFQLQHLRNTVDEEKRNCSVEFDDRLFDYQNAGVWMLGQGGCLLGDEMGTGKTVMALTAARQLHLRGKGVNAIIVVCPNSMTHRWVREAETWFPEASGIVIGGTKKAKEKAMADVVTALDGGGPVVAAINWESMQKRVGMTKLVPYGSLPVNEEGALNAVAWDVVIADEAHRAKGAKTDQSRGVAYLGRTAEYRWALTGTPVLNTPGDLWAIGRFYDPDAYGTSRHSWHNRYVAFIETHWGPKDIGLRKDRESEFTAWFDLRFIRRTKDEVLDLPEITYQQRTVELTAKQRTAYNKMVGDMIALIDDGVLVATDPLTLLTRLSQIASATPVINQYGDVLALDTPSNKVSALFEILEELDEEKQVAVFAASRKLIELAASELERKGVTTVQITGAVPPAARDVHVQQFQNGEARVALCTLGAGSEGINLYAADTAVFLQRSYSFGQSQQAEARIHRVGQESEHVTIIDVVSASTVDEAVLAALYFKQEIAEEVLRDQARELLRSKA